MSATPPTNSHNAAKPNAPCEKRRATTSRRVIIDLEDTDDEESDKSTPASQPLDVSSSPRTHSPAAPAAIGLAATTVRGKRHKTHTSARKRARVAEESYVQWLERARVATPSSLMLSGESPPINSMAEQAFLSETGELWKLANQGIFNTRIAAGSLNGTYITELEDMTTMCDGVKLISATEEEQVRLSAALLDTETRGHLYVPKRTKDFNFTKAQRMQMVGLAGLVKLSGPKTQRAVIRGKLDTTIGIRGDGGLQKLQLLVAPPGSGKTSMTVGMIVTMLCRRNWPSVVDHVAQDLLCAPVATQVYGEAKLRRIAMVVCPSAIVEQWAAGARLVFEGSDCGVGAPFEAGPGMEWVVCVSHTVAATKALIASATLDSRPQLWVIASATSSGNNKPYAPILAAKHLHVAIAVYDECTFAFARAPFSGSGYTVPMTLLVTATPSVLLNSMSNVTRHPLRIALNDIGACANNVQIVPSVLNGQLVPSASMFHQHKNGMQYLVSSNRMSASMESIRRTLALRMYVGPPELALLNRTDALATMPSALSFFTIVCVVMNSSMRLTDDVSVCGASIAVISPWKALAVHSQRIQTIANQPSGFDAVTARFRSSLKELEDETRASGSFIVDFTHLHDTLAPIVTEMENKLQSQTWRCNDVARLRTLLRASLQIVREGDSCGICYDSLDSYVPGGPTNCCGQILCVNCAKQLRKFECPFCRTPASDNFNIVQTVGSLLPEPKDRVASDMPRAPIPFGTDGDALLLRACATIQKARLDVFSAFSCAVEMSLFARVAATPRILVFFANLQTGCSRAAKSRILDKAQDAMVYDLEALSSSSQTATAAAAAIRAFKNEMTAAPIFILCNTDHNSNSLAGADLGNATAAIVVGTLRHSGETQLIGRFMRMSTVRDRPETRVFHVRCV